jgi:aminotransferase
MESLGIKSDETYVCAPAPLQHAVADALQFGDQFFDQIRNPFIQSRDKLCSALKGVGLKPIEPQGAYYVLCDYTELGYSSDVEAMNSLINDVGIGSIPGNAFFPSERNTGLLRFCFALPDELIERGCELLTNKMLRESV